MTRYLNLEKSAFRHGQYVGYGRGTFRIKRSVSAKGWWVATEQNTGETFSAYGLKGISEKLSARVES